MQKGQKWDIAGEAAWGVAVVLSGALRSFLFEVQPQRGSGLLACRAPVGRAEKVDLGGVTLRVNRGRLDNEGVDVRCPNKRQTECRMSFRK
jgi:hypothetical protein